MRHLWTLWTFSLLLLIFLTYFLYIADLGRNFSGEKRIRGKGSPKIWELYMSSLRYEKIRRLNVSLPTFKSRWTTPKECNFSIISKIFAAMFFITTESRSLSMLNKWYLKQSPQECHLSNTQGQDRCYHRLIQFDVSWQRRAGPYRAHSICRGSLFK